MNLNAICIGINSRAGNETARYRSLALDFTSTLQSFDERITFSRASNATYFDSTGTLQTAGSGVPRANAYQDHDPSTLTPLGFLIEEQRTNSIRNNTMQGAVAGVIGVSGNPSTYWLVAVNTTTGLTRTVIGSGVEDGIEYVDIRISGTASGAGSVDFNFEESTAIAALTGQTWANTVFLRLISGSFNGISNPTLFAFEYTSGGVFVASGATSPAVSLPTSAALRTQRMGGSVTLSGGATTAFVRPLLKLTIANGAAIDFTLRIGLPQLEQGAFATSPIKTTTAAAVRLADSASMTGTNFSSWFNQTEGTFVVSADINALSSAIPTAWRIDNTTDDERVFVRNNGSGVLTCIGIDGGATQWSLQTGNTLTAATRFRHALAYKANDIATAFNGSNVLTDGAATLPTVTRLLLGAANTTGGDSLNGHIQRLTYYRTRLANSTLQALTA